MFWELLSKFFQSHFFEVFTDILFTEIVSSTKHSLLGFQCSDHIPVLGSLCSVQILFQYLDHVPVLYLINIQSINLGYIIQSQGPIR
ncbi:hypothetical protein Anas_07226 [Armadillidium nasatum]|uniref:Uncharacterized protein n=1 Tax=Armadillidium nasatum TaxID=96803 RepID=A0A5N5SSL8_9CRUS|nr:hypothetical protein Anas_07226 [Armadillidium nasatum]